MSNLSFQGQHKFAGGFELEIEFSTSGNITALFGPSGSGKTTILLMIAGLLKPHDGRIQLGDRVLFDQAKGINVPCQQRNIGMVFQDLLLFPHINVEANLKYGLRRNVQSHSKHESEHLFQRVCGVLELEKIRNRYPRNLSGGERQRVAIGRALLSSPDMLLLDEPLAWLDLSLNTQILAYLEQIIAEWKIPTVFVSHRQGHVRRLAKWVIVIDQGRKVAEGKPDVALTHRQPLAWQHPWGPVNLLRVQQIEHSGDRWIGQIGQQTLQLPDAKDVADSLFVQFSPHDVILSREDVAGLSTRNHLRGIVRQIVTLPQGEFVAVDVGQIIWSNVTRQAVQQLEIQPGQEVTCLIKTQSLQLVG